MSLLARAVALLPRQDSGNETDFDPDAGCRSCATKADNSLSALISTLVPVAAVACVYFIFFLILRKSQRRYYAPRTYLGSLPERYATPGSPLLVSGC